MPSSQVEYIDLSERLHFCRFLTAHGEGVESPCGRAVEQGQKYCIEHQPFAQEEIEFKKWIQTKERIKTMERELLELRRLESLMRLRFATEHQTEVYTLLRTRELEALGHVVRGLSNKEIAEKMVVSERTIKFHVSNLLTKFKVSNRYELSKIVQEMKIPLMPDKNVARAKNKYVEDKI